MAALKGLCAWLESLPKQWNSEHQNKCRLHLKTAKKKQQKTERSEKFNWLFAGSFSSCYPHNQITPQPSDLASWYIESLTAISTQIYHPPSPPTLLAGKLILLRWKQASTPASVYWIREIMKSLLVVQIRHEMLGLFDS